MIVLTGMHLSVATHLCAGELAAIKWSFADEKASCGMEKAKIAFTSEKTFEAENCCKDLVSFYSVDTNYNSSSIHINKPVHQLLQVFFIPVITGQNFHNSALFHNTNVQPPGQYTASAVSLPDICVFLI